MTELDKKLQEIACKNWEQFAVIIGPEALIDAKICLLRRSKASYGEIMQRLGLETKLTKDQVRYQCKQCEDDPIEIQRGNGVTT